MPSRATYCSVCSVHRPSRTDKRVSVLLLLWGRTSGCLFLFHHEPSPTYPQLGYINMAKQRTIWAGQATNAAVASFRHHGPGGCASVGGFVCRPPAEHYKTTRPRNEHRSVLCRLQETVHTMLQLGQTNSMVTLDDSGYQSNRRAKSPDLGLFVGRGEKSCF